MLSIYESIIDFLNTNFFGLTFGLIISIILFLIDRGEKHRQEETLRRQDESLDIILEQVSKLNVFQTRTLSLAIESIGKDFDELKNDVDFIKTSISYVDMNSREKLETRIAGRQVTEQNIPVTPSPSPSSSGTFGQVLSNQINSFISQIRSNISDLSKSDQDSHKDLYKFKKGLEFDIKDLLNIQSMLNELKKDMEVPDDTFHEKQIDKDIERTPVLKEEPSRDSSNSLPKMDEISAHINIDNFDNQLKNLHSIPEIVKFTESIIKKFENFEEKNSKLKENSSKVTNERKKVKPTKILSKKDTPEEKQ